MTRKDFELIADTLRRSKPTPMWSGDMLPEWEQWRRTVDNFATELARCNSGFKRDRFEKACGLTAEPPKGRVVA